MNKSFIQYKE